MTNARLDTWHKVVFTKDMDLLATLLADDVEFHSPFLFKPKRGAQVLSFILASIIDITENFTYHREFSDGDDMALEFSANVGDIKIKGIDLIHYDADGKIDHFEVMLRPAKALMTVAGLMTERMEKAGLV